MIEPKTSLTKQEKDLLEKESKIELVEIKFKQCTREEKERLIKENINPIIHDFRSDFISNKFWSFQSIDYRGPMEDWNNPSIGIFAGLSTSYSINLCNKLIDDDFINKVNELKEKKWTIEFNLYFKNGSGFNNNSISIPLDFNSFKSLNQEKRKNLLKSEEIHGKKSAYDVFNDNFVEYLLELKKLKVKTHNLLDSNKFLEWTKELITYFTKDLKGINNSKTIIDNYFNKNEICKNEFNEWKKENKINWNINEIKKLCKDKEIDFSKLYEAIEIAVFKKWKNDKKISFVEDIKYSCCCVYFGWSLVLKYQLTDFDDIKNNEEELANIFKDRTIEGVTPFGNEYKDWFENVVFN